MRPLVAAEDCPAQAALDQAFRPMAFIDGSTISNLGNSYKWLNLLILWIASRHSIKLMSGLSDVMMNFGDIHKLSLMNLDQIDH